MKELIKLSLVICLVFVACTDKKEKETKKVEETKEVVLEGLWTLKSGKWSNGDGTFLRYPEDSILHGSAFILYGKNHFMVVSEAPRMNYFRGELVKYSIDGNKLNATRIVSNIEELKGKSDVWTFKIEGDLFTGTIRDDIEVWKRVE